MGYASLIEDINDRRLDSKNKADGAYPPAIKNGQSQMASSNSVSDETIQSIKSANQSLLNIKNKKRSGIAGDETQLKLIHAWHKVLKANVEIADSEEVSWLLADYEKLVNVLKKSNSQIRQEQKRLQENAWQKQQQLQARINQAETALKTWKVIAYKIAFVGAAAALVIIFEVIQK